MEYFQFSHVIKLNLPQECQIIFIDYQSMVYIFHFQQLNINNYKTNNDYLAKQCMFGFIDFSNNFHYKSPHNSQSQQLQLQNVINKIAPMKHKKLSPFFNQSFYHSKINLLPDINRDSPTFKTNLFQYTTKSTTGNFDITNPSLHEVEFTVDAIITKKNQSASNSKLIQAQREKFNNKIYSLKRQPVNILQTEAGSDYFHSFVQKEREKRIEKKFKEMIESEKQEFEQKVRIHSVNKERTRLSDAIRQNKSKYLDEKRRTAELLKTKMNMSLMQVIRRKEQSLEDNRSRRDQIIENENRIKQKKKKQQYNKITRAFTNLEDKITHYDQEARKTNHILGKLREKESKLERKNVELVNQFHRAIDAIRKLEA